MVTNPLIGNVKQTQLTHEMRSSYLDYAMSVIVSRALPDVRDGLKPVQRRILFAMHELGMRPGTAYKKSARLVGEVLGKYHPHGDSAIYDAMVRMAQDFSMRMTLVDGQGNFGSVDGDRPAAMRYTEARLSKVAEEMLINLDEETVNTADNFDSTLQEPSVLPARLPNLLINGASGIAVGMATNIPPHNPGEVCSAIIRLIDNPELTIPELMKSVRAPDFPTYGTMMGTEGALNAYTTGKGGIIVRAKAEIEADTRGKRLRIVVTELPYQVNKSTLIENIAGLSKTKRFEAITEVRDESDRNGMRMVFELRGGSQPLVVLNNLYKYTPMQTSFSANILALVDGRPRVLDLKTILVEFIKFRREIITRRSEFELRKCTARAHILEGLSLALNDLDAVIELIRHSDSAEAAKKGLIERFSLSDIQAQAILDMQLRRIAALERQRIEDEYKAVKTRISELESLLADPAKIDAVIKSETEEVKKKHGDKRRTKIEAAAEDLNREDLEPHESVVVTLSHSGYIKRIPATTYRSQHRGGKGVISMKTKEDDLIRELLVCDSHDILLFFTEKGRVLPLKTYELRPDTSRNTRGTPLINVVPLKSDDKINAVVSVSNLEAENTFLVMGTREGAIKRVSLASINTLNKRRSGLNIMNLRETDELVTARVANETDDVVMVSQQGMSIRFALSDVTARQRAAGGVRGMEIRPTKVKGKKKPVKDYIVGMSIIASESDSKLFVISKKGLGKLTSLKHYRQQARGGRGLKTFKITARTGVVAAAEVVTDDLEVYVISKQAKVLRTNLSEISSIGRITQGVTIFKLPSGDSVSSISVCEDIEPQEAFDIEALNSQISGNKKSPKK
ncbi:MAG: DNA gyrase subunit A [Chloroflexi bacterium]|jgi:DNA gyrase subunit A|nr:MAG: DNA gyrase subunit A [Chloroflexota bacterium]